MNDLANLQIRVDSSSARTAGNDLDRLADKGGKAEGSVNNVTTAARFATHELANLSYQLNDVVVGLISGQNPMIVFTQQGAQMAQILGSRPGGIAAGLQALRNLIPASAVAFGAAAVAVGVAAKAFLDYRNSADKAVATMAGLGRFAGITGAEMLAMSEDAASAGNVSVKASREMAASFAATGQIGSEVFEQLISLQHDYAVITGRDSKEATEALGEAFANPIKGAEMLNSELGILNATQMEHIRNLVEEGDKTAAQKYLADALASSVRGLAEDYGGLGEALYNVGRFASDAWNQLGKLIDRADQWKALQVRRVDQGDLDRAALNPFMKQDMQIGDWTVDLWAPNREYFDRKSRLDREERERTEQARLNRASATGAALAQELMPNGLGTLREQQSTLEKALAAQRRLGETDALKSTTEAYNAVTRAIQTYLPPAEKAHQLAQLDARLAAAKTPQQKAALAAERERLKAAGEVVTAEQLNVRASDAAALASARASSSSDRRTESLQRQADAMVENTRGQLALAAAYLEGDAAALRAEARRRAATDATRRGTDVEAQYARQLGLTIAEEAANAAQSVADIRARNSAIEEATRLVAEGNITASQASEHMQRQIALRSVLAAAEVAEGESREQLLEIIKALNSEYERETELKARQALTFDIQNQRDQLEILDLELKMINATNREREVALVQLRAIQELRSKGVDPASDQGAKYVANAMFQANKRQDLDMGVGSAIREAELYMETLDRMVARSDFAASAMSKSFDDFGAALGELTSAIGQFAVQEERLALERMKRIEEANGDAERLRQIELDYTRDVTQARVRSYADMAGAAKGMFRENTVGYEALQKAEAAFRIFEFAMSVKSVAVKATETAAKIGLFGAQAQAAAAAGAANMFATLGPAGFAAVAAMVAVLAGMGMKSLGGGGSIPGANDMADRQARQGAGTVLGDVSSASESLKRSIEIVASNTNEELEYSNEMLRALKSIDNQIGAVAAALARSFGAGGMLSTEGLGLGSTSSISTLTKILNPFAMLAPALFGKTTTKTLQDAGLQFDSASLEEILMGGLSGQTYQQVLTNTKKKFFGVTYSDKNSSNTTYGSVDKDFLGQTTLLIESMRDGVLAAAGVLGVTGAEETLNAFQVELGKLSFKDMTGEEIQQALESIFSKLGDQMALSVIPGLEQFQKVGEGTLETLMRVARGYQVVDVAMASIGKTFPLVGVESIAAREHLIDLAGGLEELADKTARFAEDFLTEQERMLPVVRSVAYEMARLGHSSVDTKDEFKNLVLGLDLSTEAGRQMYASLMAVAPAFAQVQNYLMALQGVEEPLSALDALKKAQNDLRDAYEEEADGIQNVIDRLTTFAKSLRSFMQQLMIGPQAQLSNEEQYLTSKALFEDVRARAMAGDAEAQAQYTDVANAFLEASKEYNTTSEQYFRDLATVKEATKQMESMAQTQIDAAQAQLDALTKLVEGYIVLNGSVLSVRDAIAALAAAQSAHAAAVQAALVAAQQAANDALAAANRPPANDNTSSSSPWNPSDYLATNPDVLAEAQRLLSIADRNSPWFQEHGLDKGVEGFAEWHYNTTGRGEGRKWASGAVMTRPTYFARDEMAEAGPEAIMPLTQIGGKLGVRASIPDNGLSERIDRLIEVMEASNVQRGAGTQEILDALARVENTTAKGSRQIARQRKAA